MRTISTPVTGSWEYDAGTPARDATLRQAIRVLGRPGDADLDEIADLARGICEADLAAITIIVDDECHHVATVGFDPMVCAARDTFCHHLRRADQSVVVEDARVDERFADSPYVDGSLEALRFYASAPIHTAGGDIVGRLCVYGREPQVLSPNQQRALVTLAQGIGRILELRLREDVSIPSARRASISEEGLQIAGQISHDIRNPLTTMMASLEMLQESAPQDEDPTRVRLLASALRATVRLDTMVEGLLRLNRIGQRLQLADVRLGEVARQVVDDARATLEEAGAVVHLGTLPEVRADPGQMYSVLSNLVNNAVKFARPGVPPVIDIRARRTDHGWRISVADNGLGIPAEMHQEIFRMFARLDTSVEGSGIGLATVQRIVEAHGGKVGVDDTRGRGTEVWFELAGVHPGRPVTP